MGLESGKGHEGWAVARHKSRVSTSAPWALSSAFQGARRHVGHRTADGENKNGKNGALEPLGSEANQGVQKNKQGSPFVGNPTKTEREE